MNTLYHQNQVQEQIFLKFDEECKIRPTYSEIIDFIAKREPDVAEKTVFTFDMVQGINQELQHKFEVVSEVNRGQVDDYKHQLKVFREITMENFRKISKKVDKHMEERKGLVKFVRNWKILSKKKMKLELIFAKWKNMMQSRKKARIKVKKILKKKDCQRQQKGWNRLKGAYLLTRMKKFEGHSIKALLRSDDCHDKLLGILPEVLDMKKNKVSTEDFSKLASAVQRTNYESVYKDLVGMIEEESQKLQSQIEVVNRVMTENLKNFTAELRQNLNLSGQGSIFKDVHQVKSEIESLKNMNALLNERISRVDYCNMKEDSEFKLEVLSKQLKTLENKVLSISNSQDSITDQTSYLRSILLCNKPSNNTIMKPSTSTTATKAFYIENNSTQVPENELSVSGVYLKPNKRVNSASPAKRRVNSQLKKHRIPTSFSNTLTINESPMLWFNKGT